MNIFVAHPYSLPGLEIEDYRRLYLNIEASNTAIKFSYADEKINGAHVLDKIEKMIFEADYSFFDVTGWNPNVALELGLAKGLKKPYYILFNPKIGHNSEVPSDIRGLGRLEYTSYADLQRKASKLLDDLLYNLKSDVRVEYSQIAITLLNLLRIYAPLTSKILASYAGMDVEITEAFLNQLVNSKKVQIVEGAKARKYVLPPL